jgi:hypothetical protein
MDASVAARWTTKGLPEETLVDPGVGRVSVRPGLGLMTEFQVRNPPTGKPVGVWRVWCSGVLIIVGSVLGLIAALRGARLDMPVAVDPVFSLSALFPGWRGIVVDLPTVVGLPVCVGLPVNAALFVEMLTCFVPPPVP